MQRVPEPEELMDEPAQAAAYAEADFGEPNALFVSLLETLAGPTLEGRALDLGCGPAEIPLALLARHPGLHIDALDGAEAMLEQARARAARHPEAAARLSLHRLRLPCSALPRAPYDFLLSNSLLHHLEDPAVLWRTLRGAGRPGAGVLVMDLARPADPETLEALVQTHAGEAPEVLRRDFRNSLRAAWRVDEVAQQLQDAGLGHLEVAMVSDRHLAVRGHL